ncbi:hypothetical protein Pmani_034262 [Petrolisthes manimaculis]|uniref:Cytochrome c oxidase polypeptide VIII n=1 Tax=Petrolisthes manimaculis TaxID=1843537 RepID=A0AAE1TPL2_9EUCA|nr:hypothetical protein Pmani_034262 [Petrolisthes manimaculis]
MFALRTVASRISQANSSLVVAKRSHNVIAGPPRTKISFLEKSVHGIMISVGIMFVPGWVLVHIKDYRGRD